jgi:RNA polymerase-interacting CarD/CdnL/TRCF family regulator
MFKIGDTVTYKNEGVCSIFEIAERDFSGTRAKYYVLRPIYKETTRLYVPVDNEKIIIEEFALALGIKPSQALEYIEKKLYD